MKKYYLFVSVLIISSTSFAQHKKEQKLVSVRLGFSGTGLLIKAIGKADLFSKDSFSVGNISTSKRPAISAAFDFSLTDRLSLGGIFSHQVFSGEINDYKGPTLEPYPKYIGPSKTKILTFIRAFGLATFYGPAMLMLMTTILKH